MAEIIRNPSPPHHLDEEGTELKQLLEKQADDIITNTIFSQSWIITTMNRVVQYVQKGLMQNRIANSVVNSEPIIVDLTDSSPETRRDSSPKRVKLNNERDTAIQVAESADNDPVSENLDPAGTPRAVKSVPPSQETSAAQKDKSPNSAQDRELLELDPEIEKEFSDVWDATVNQHVAMFFSENNLVPILIHTVCNSRYPRLNEMCMGVLANLACNSEVAEKEFSSPQVAWFSCTVLTCDDPQTLLETLRLTETCVSNESTQEVWCSVFEDQKVIDTVQFIFDSSTNIELLFSLSRIVDLLLDLWSPLLHKFSTMEMTYALCEAHGQIMHLSLETAVNLIMILHQLSTAEEGVQVLLKLYSTVVDTCSNHVMILHEELGPQLAFSDASYRAAVSLLLLTVENLKIKLGTLLMEGGKDLLSVLGDIYQKNIELYSKEASPNPLKSSSLNKSSVVIKDAKNCEQKELLEKTHLLEESF